jgi:large conductance mechanosensitive channel
MEKIAEDFFSFLKEYGVIGLAIAVVIGTAAKDLVSAVVDDVVMPIVGLLLPGGDWQTATFSFGSATFKIGHLIATIIDFLIIAFLIYLFVRYAMGKEKVEKI